MEGDFTGEAQKWSASKRVFGQDQWGPQVQHPGALPGPLWNCDQPNHYDDNHSPPYHPKKSRKHSKAAHDVAPPTSVPHHSIIYEDMELNDGNNKGERDYDSCLLPRHKI